MCFLYAQPTAPYPGSLAVTLLGWKTATPLHPAGALCYETRLFPLPQPIHYASVVRTAPKALRAAQGSELCGPTLVETVSLVNAHWLPIETQVKAPKCNSTWPRGAPRSHPEEASGRAMPSAATPPHLLGVLGHPAAHSILGVLNPAHCYCSSARESSGVQRQSSEYLLPSYTRSMGWVGTRLNLAARRLVSGGASVREV